MEYVSVQRGGRKVQSDHFFMLVIDFTSTAATSRVGVTISSKVGNAVVRNRLKRWVREYLRHHFSELPGGEAVVIAKASAANVGHPMIDRDLKKLFARARMAA